MRLFEEEDEDSLYLKLVNNLSKLRIQESRPNGDLGVLLATPSSEYQRLWHQQTKADRTLPRLEVFQAIASKYPDYGTVEELIKRYKKIQDEKTGKNLIADIDDAGAVAVSAERALNSYKSLLCPRCFMYDCPLHHDPVVEDSLKLEMRDVALPTGPCGAECYLHLPNVRAQMSPRSGVHSAREENVYRPQLARAAARKLLGPRYASAARLWVDSEVTMFR